jgi:hypothetical protein
VSAVHRATVERLLSLELPDGANDHLIASGYKFEPAPRQWARLTQKLVTPGSKVKIVAFGGSVTVGYRMSKTSYPEQLVEWLKASLPGVEFELTNLARRATAATFAALCLVQVRLRFLFDVCVAFVCLFVWQVQPPKRHHERPPLQHKPNRTCRPTPTSFSLSTRSTATAASARWVGLGDGGWGVV